MPVFKMLHPGREASRSQLRKDGRVSYSHAGQTYSRHRTLFAVGGTFGGIVCILFLFFSILRPFIPARRHLPFIGEADTLIFNDAEIERVWLWEIASGRYPSKRRTDFELGDARARVYRPGTAAVAKLSNPGVPRSSEGTARRESLAAQRLRHQTGEAERVVAISLPDPTLAPIGAPRQTIAIASRPVYTPRSSQDPPSNYPPRPVINSAIDLDTVMDYCDFSTNQYVRDCLEVLRMNAGMDSGVRRGHADNWRTNFLLSRGTPSDDDDEVPRALHAQRQTEDMTELLNSTNFASLLAERQKRTLIPPAQHYEPHPTHPTADPACDPDYPRIFHIFWAGPFTDKPYSAALSFLFTQRLGLEQPLDFPHGETLVCRPQLWIWINPGPASSLPDPNARSTMLRELSANPWSSPLLHRRFDDSIKFKLWNTTEQLDAVSEMKGWREMRLFNSGGVKYGAAGEKKIVPAVVPPKPIVLDKDGLPPAAIVTDESDTSKDHIVEAEADRLINITSSDISALASSSTTSLNASLPTLPPKKKDQLFARIGSSSSNDYDRLSVVLSDMARFVLTHRFGVTYLDADTILLRDWEEIWGWHGAFAYRWSRLKTYNTAVLKMQRGSALGNFIFRTAVANELDFHPMTVSRYTRDAKVEGLLLRLPDALFDAAWLSTEDYQRDRPPTPYFQRFEDFFETPRDQNSAPNAVGFDGFFKGSFSYHFHNFWWKPFDYSRNFPDLGPRFAAGERKARGRLLAAKLAATPAPSPAAANTGSTGPSPTKPEPQKFKNVVGPTGTASSEVTPVYKWGDDERDFDGIDWSNEIVEEDGTDLSWSAVLKRTFESFLRGERANMYGEWLDWDDA